MVKTFLFSPLIGATTAVLGWICAILLMSTMDDATFDSLRFGWAGLMVGSVALVAAILILTMSDIVEPLVTALAAAGVAAALWGRRELPVTNSYQVDTPAFYWATITMMAVVLLLLFVGLRAARITNRRARG